MPSEQRCVCDVSYLYYLASAPRPLLNSIRLAMSSVITRWAIFPLRPLVSDLWAEGAEEVVPNSHEGLSWSLCWRRDMRETSLQHRHQYLCLGVQKEDVVIPASRSPPCVYPRFRLESTENKFVPLSALIFSLLSSVSNFIWIVKDCYGRSKCIATLREMAKETLLLLANVIPLTKWQ